MVVADNSKKTLTLKPGQRDTGKMLQKHFRSQQQEIYTQFLQELTANSFAFGPYRTLTTENRKLEVTSYVYSDGRILSVFRPRGRAGKRLQLVHFAQIIDGVEDRVANRGFVVFDYREQAYYFAKGARSFSRDLRVTLQGSFKRRKTLLIPAADLRRNYTWLTFAPPGGGIQRVEYDFAD